MEEQNVEETSSDVPVAELEAAAKNEAELFTETKMTPSAAAAGEATVAVAKPPAAAPVTPAPKSGGVLAEAQSEPAKAFTMEQANEEIANLLESGKVTQQEVQSLQGLMREHAALKVKVDRLKGLLGRSAKAQREAKVELEATQKRLDQALRDVQRLNQKVEHLSTRPTHMDLLADFETNFDRALLSVGQTGGQDTAAPVAHSNFEHEKDQSMDAMLMQELEECRSRISRLESINSSLSHRANQLESDVKDRRKERDDLKQKLSHTELELRMARMEAEDATRKMHEKAASLEEMQMEIDLVTKASMKANVRAAQGEAVAKSSKTDKEHIQQLEAQVQALKEWALASAEAKRLASERVSLLERKLKNKAELEHAVSGELEGRSVYNKKGSLVIGAGEIGSYVVELDDQFSVGTRLVLQWKFDATPSDCSTNFNVMKGKCETAKEQKAAEYLIKDRTVTGGAAGEVEDAFSVQNACTLLWSNKKSWIRPRTIKFVLGVICYD